MSIIKCPHCKMDISLTVKRHKKQIKTYQITLNDRERKFRGITYKMFEDWEKQFNKIDVKKAIRECASYWLAQPRIKWKTDWEATIYNRLRWCQDKNLCPKQITHKARYYSCSKCGKPVQQGQICSCERQGGKPVQISEIVDIMGGKRFSSKSRENS